MSDPGKRLRKRGAEATSDAQSSQAASGGSADRLLKIGRSIGNDAFQDRLSEGDQQRKSLVDFAMERLRKMYGAQMAEVQAGSYTEMRKNWKEIGDSHKEDKVKPEPMRWGEAARIYRDATYQLCRGDLDRGRQLLENAIEAERKAREALGKNVDLADGDKDGPEAPGTMQEIVPNQACAPCALPDGLDIADAIMANQTTVQDPPVKKRGKDPWWTDLEEEEEEEAAEGGAS